MLNLPKINIGTKKKKNYFDQSHDVNTTADFGFCQPTLVDTIPADTHVSLKSQSFVRLAPLVAPSFARIKMRTENIFIPMSDVFEGYEHMLSGDSINARNLYTPIQADYVNNKQLWGYALLVNWQFAFNFLVEALQAVPSIYVMSTPGSKPLRTSYSASSHKSLVNSLFTTWQVPQLSDTQLSDVFRLSDYIADDDWSAMPPIYSYLKGLSFESADYVIALNSGTSVTYLTLHLTHSGRRLIKVLNACGYVLDDIDAVPLYPLFAYYKAWFDTYNPARTLNWRTTRCYSLIHRYYDYGTTLASYINQVTQEAVNAKADFLAFMCEMYSCCFTLEPDPITVCQSSFFTQNLSGSSTSDTYEPLISTDPNERYNVQSLRAYNDDEPYIDTNEYPFVTGIGIKALLKLRSRLNKHSVIGKRVEKFVNAIYGDQLPERFYFGHHDIQIPITDVMSTSDTAKKEGNVRTGSLLGEYAGQGKQYSHGDRISFDTKTLGVLVQLTTIIPLGGYSQGKHSRLPVTRMSFYTSDYDSLGMEAVSKSEVFGKQSVVDRVLTSSTFGFRPRFMGWKFHLNLRNGDFFNRGRKQMFLAYNLDRLFSENDVVQISDSLWQRQSGMNNTVNENMRFVGREEWQGNYNRLFYDVSGNTDNFIIQMFQEYSWHAPMLAISDSFDTFDDETDNRDTTRTTVQHS